jgi:hypothetical protein
LALSLIQVACPSVIVCCFTCNSSILWWTVHAPCGGLLLAAMFRMCKCCNPNVFTLWLMHLGMVLTGNHIRPLTESLDSKLCDVGSPLVQQLWRHLCLPRTVWSHQWVRRTSAQKASRGCPNKAAKLIQWLVSYPYWGFHDFP